MVKFHFVKMDVTLCTSVQGSNTEEWEEIDLTND